jgi:hypothetical protein
MIFTGKNADKFDAWLQTKPEFRSLIQITTNHQPMPSHWKRQPIEIITGVALAYYDSLGLRVNMDGWYDMQGTYRTSFWYDESKDSDVIGKGKNYGFQSQSRNEAYKEAFKKADEIINQLPK